MITAGSRSAQRWAALLVLAAGAGHAAPPPTCVLVVIPDYALPGLAYRAVLRLSPACPPDVTLRVRKTSALSRKRTGAPYQPIRPLTGAWNLGLSGTTIPDRELWTSTVTGWRWQYYDEALNRWRDALRPS